MYNKEALTEIVREKALAFGDFTLASGKKSNHYIDCRKVVLDSKGSFMIAEAMLDVLSEDMPDLVGGLAIGADPITGAVVAIAGTKGQDLRGLMVRKEAKKHGTGQFVEGDYQPGESVVILEDVITTGGSAMLAIERCEAVGLKIAGVLAILDRLQGGKEAFAAKGHKLTALLTIEDLGISPE